MCNLSPVFFFFFIFFIKKKIFEKNEKKNENVIKKLDKLVELVVGGSIINGAYPVLFLYSYLSQFNIWT